MEIWPQMPVGVLNRSLGSPHHEYPASQIAAETQCSSRYFSEKVSVAISVELWYMFVLQGGERMKYKLLKDLYDCFYTPSCKFRSVSTTCTEV